MNVDEKPKSEDLQVEIQRQQVQKQDPKLIPKKQNKLAESERKLVMELSRVREELALEKMATSGTVAKMNDEHQREKQDTEERYQYLIKELEEHHQDDLKPLEEQNRALLRQWEVDRSEVEFDCNDSIGSGGWGTIHKGKFRGIFVAVKKIYPHIMSIHNEKLVRREIGLLSQVRHPNILLLLGAVVSDFKKEGETSLLITELLDTDLRSAYGRGLIHEESKLPILHNVASALVYLHTSRVPMIHRDVSSSNVLLEAVNAQCQWKAKLSDFGSANVISKSTTPNAGAVIYAAPELISDYGQPQTDKVDVYSFGVLICEVVLCSLPPYEKKKFIRFLHKIFDKQDLYQLAKQCTKHLYQDRPSMTEVQTALEEVTY